MTAKLSVKEMCIFTYIYTYIHTNIHTYTHTYIHTYTHTHIHTYIHTHTHTHTHTYIHTFYLPKITSTTTVEIKSTKVFSYSLVRKSTSENDIYAHPYYLLLKTDELYKCDLTYI